MKGIKFGELHSYNDLKMILSGKEMGAPGVKSKKLDIEGADSFLDLTDFFGEPKYEDVTHKFKFHTIVPYSEFLTLYSRIKNAIHGKKMRVILDDDPLFYWMGRIYVSSFTNDRNIGTIEVECDCEPYKYKLTKTVYSQAVSGTQVITLTNGRKRAVPEITTTGVMTIEYGGGSWTIGAGSYTIPEIELVNGTNKLTVTGTGTITFTWQEGDL